MYNDSPLCGQVRNYHTCNDSPLCGQVRNYHTCNDSPLCGQVRNYHTCNDSPLCGQERKYHTCIMTVRCVDRNGRGVSHGSQVKDSKLRRCSASCDPAGNSDQALFFVFI